MKRHLTTRMKKRKIKRDHKLKLLELAYISEVKQVATLRERERNGEEILIEHVASVSQARTHISSDMSNDANDNVM